MFFFFKVLALNRGEQNKVLTVKLTIPKNIEKQFLVLLRKTWVPCDAPGTSCMLTFFEKAVKYMYIVYTLIAKEK